MEATRALRSSLNDIGVELADEACCLQPSAGILEIEMLVLNFGSGAFLGFYVALNFTLVGCRAGQS